MTSISAAEIQGRTFRRVLVLASFADLGLRQETERRFVEENETGQTKFVASSAVFFPGRQYSAAEVTAGLEANDIDATLVITPGRAGSKSGHVPPTYTSGCTSWTSSGGCQQVTTSSSGGYSFSKPWEEFTAQMYDAKTGHVVWYATATTGGNAYASASTLVHSMAAKTVEKLKADGVVR